MKLRWVVSLGIVLAASGALADEAAPPARPAGEATVGGQYDVTGVTVSQRDGSSRAIYGRVVLVISGDRYKSHFELSTLYPGSAAAAARVVGTGEGSVEGNALRGEADAHVVLASAPGVDVGFAMIPAQVGARIESSTRATLFDDGSVRIEIDNRPAEGETYDPTRTTLVGFRIAPR